MFRAMACQKKMLSMPNNTEEEWTAKLHMVLTFEKTIKQDYFSVNEDAQPLEKFAKQAAKGILASMHLLLRRPPYKQHYGLVPSSDDFNVLEHATIVLQHDSIIKSAEFAPWAWKSWVKWYALAIVLVELYSQSPGEKYDAAYSIAVQSFSRYSRLIADSDTGLLWKPIVKLMRRLQQLRGFNGISEQASNLSTMLDVHEPVHVTSFDSWIPDLSLNPDTDAGNPFICQSDQNEAQINWFTFTHDVDMDFSNYVEDGLF
jgi:hypothetical protein